MSSVELQKQIDTLPEYLKKEVEDFVQSLITKSKERAILKKDLSGVLKGKIKMSDDFDAPLDDFKEYM